LHTQAFGVIFQDQQNKMNFSSKLQAARVKVRRLEVHGRGQQEKGENSFEIV
jgi:hypothetical protein